MANPVGPDPDNANDPTTQDTVLGAVVPTVGAVFAARYLIKEEIGHGAFGVVYRAQDLGPLQRTVALKTIRLPALSDEEAATLARRRFLEEARLAATLSHPNIATVFEVAEKAGVIYMTQELAPGRDLAKLIRQSGPIPLRRTIAIVRQICEGLAHAHARGIIHRDIKPGNVVVDDDDRVKITDFGIAQPHEHDSPLGNTAGGTPGYAAPEQLCGERADPRADVFSIGCVLYEMLTGRCPFEGSTVASIIEKTLHAFPPPPSGIHEELPRALDRVVDRALRKNRDERYESVAILAQDILNWEPFEYLLDAQLSAGEIAVALEARSCIVFVGLDLQAGSDPRKTSHDLILEFLAGQSGTPREGRSLARLSQDLEIERGRPEMLRHLASAVRNPQASPREIIRRIARLPFRVIVTTRYDSFLEQELTRTGRRFRRVIDCRRVPDDSSEDDMLVLLFGTIDDEASIVVTEDDLWSFFGTFQLLSDTLKAALARHTILFAGYDPEDESFRHLVIEILRYRPGARVGCYLPVADASLGALRWSHSKGLHLIDAEPGAYLSSLEQALTERRREQVAGEPVPTAVSLPQRPYKFLNYFDAADELIYFGRQNEIGKLASKIHSYTLNVAYGASGCGKTSLICAALMPRLRREGDTAVYVRVFDDPPNEIRRAVLEAFVENAVDHVNTPLPQLVSQLATSREQQLVIFIDQLEELFIRHDRDARDRFATDLERAMALGKGRVRFVLSLREDFLARLSELRDRLPTIFHNEFRLEKLSADATRAAIVEPANLFGLHVEPALVDQLIEDLFNEGVDPPQLQIVCDTLYDALPAGERRLTLESYRALGGTRKILTNYLERVLREAPSNERHATREVLKQLVTAEDTKSVSRLSDLARLTARSEDEVSRILADLSNRRLVREAQREDGYWYELSHEYLVQEIGQWLSLQDKELKRVRELLEQAVRNRRNLGILMPRPQTRLVRQFEDGLNLSKEERQLVRDSEDVVRKRKKTVAAAAAAAALLLAVSGVSARYAYLTTHQFIQSSDRELLEVYRGTRIGHRFEGISVFAGSPTRSWLDARLGYPRFLYQTDFDLNQLDPARRDELKAGAILGGASDIDAEILGMLQPSERARFLMTTERTDRGFKLLQALYSDRSVGQASLDRLTTIAAHSGLVDMQVVQAAVRHAFRPENLNSSSSPLEGGPTPSIAGPIRPIVPILARLPDEGWRRVVIPYLSDPVSRERALALIAVFGTSQDAGVVQTYFTDLDAKEDVFASSNQALPLQALNMLGDCSAIDGVRKLIGHPTVAALTKQASYEYIRRCGNVTDLRRLEQAGRGAVSAASLAAGWESEHQIQFVIQALHQMFGAAGVPAIRRLLARVPLSSSKLDYVAGIEADFSQDFRDGLRAPQVRIRVAAAVALAERGDPSGVPIAVQVAQDRGEDLGSRLYALRTFVFVRGASIRTLLAKLARTATEAEVRARAIRALRWYDDDDTLAVLFAAFKDGDRYVRDEALESFEFLPPARTTSYLEKRWRDGSVGAAIYAIRVLQRSRQGHYVDTYRDLLSKATGGNIDYSTLGQALVGLRNAYLDEPLRVVVDALSDPHREVRLAATVALVNHRNRSEGLALLRDAEPRSPFAMSIQRARWALRIAQQADALPEHELWPQTRSESRRESHAFRECVSALKFGLSNPQFPTENEDVREAEASVFDELFALRMEEDDPLLNVDAFLRWAPEGALALQKYDPTLRGRLRDEPRFAKWRSFYAFRVLTGLQEPITVSADVKS